MDQRSTLSTASIRSALTLCGHIVQGFQDKSHGIGGESVVFRYTPTHDLLLSLCNEYLHDV